MKKPTTEVRTTTLRTARLDLDQETVEFILANWVRVNVPEFQDLKVEVLIDSGRYEGCRFSCEVTGKSEEIS